MSRYLRYTAFGFCVALAVAACSDINVPVEEDDAPNRIDSRSVNTDTGVPPADSNTPMGCVDDSTCNDNDSCTEDKCDTDGLCIHFSKTNICKIDNSCYADAQPSSADACLICDVTADAGSWAGLECDDDNECTSDTCDTTSGCAFVPDDALSCDDGVACSTDDHCDGGQCVGTCGCANDAECMVQYPPGPCEQSICEQSVCKLIADPAQDGTACDDNDACTIDEECSSGQCGGGKPVSCDDQNPCTDDMCPDPTGCKHTNNLAPCDDNDSCTTTDTCQNGSCAPGPPLLCNDNNPCTDDTCDTPTGCKYTGNSNACDDDDPCTENGQCGCVGGACGQCLSAKVDCDDNNPCTDDSCGPSGCTHINVSNGTACDDGNPCNSNDICSGGNCVGSGGPNCDDNNPCTTDGCDSASGCTHTNNTANCNDGDNCTTGDQCSGGNCVSTGSKSCDDALDCTVDTCVPSTGNCKHTSAPITAACDFLASGGGHCDGAGECVCFAAGTPIRTTRGMVAIESVRIGDVVPSFNARTGVTQWRPVRRIEKNQAHSLLTVTLSTGELIHATPEHFFWVIGDGWVPARELKTGEVLKQLDGRPVTVTTVEAQPQVTTPQGQWVYNLIVEGSKTYFVGQTNVLVHSCNTTLNVLEPEHTGHPTPIVESTDPSVRTLPMLVYYSISASLSVVEKPGEPSSRVVDLPCFKLSKWAMRVGMWNGHLVVLDATDFSIKLISLNRLDQVLSGTLTCSDGDDYVARRIPLRFKQIPYAAILHHDSLYITYNAHDRIERYRWMAAAPATAPDLRFEASLSPMVDSTLGLGQPAVFNNKLLVPGSALVCTKSHCKKRYEAPHLFGISLDLVKRTGGPGHWTPATVNSVAVYVHPKSANAFVLNAGNLFGGGGSIQKLSDGGLPGLETRLPKGAHIARAFPLTEQHFAALSLSGDHLFVMDASTNKLAAIFQFDGETLQTVPTLVDRLPSRTGADLHDIIADPIHPHQYFMVDSKGEQLVHWRFDAASKEASVLSAQSIAGPQRRTPSWGVWLRSQ